MNELTCGECRYFRVAEVRDDGQVGRCRLQKLMGVFRDSHNACPSFSRRGDPDPPVVVDTGRASARRRRAPGPRPTLRRTEVNATAISEALAALDAVTLKSVLRRTIQDAITLREIDLGRSWDQGELVLVPAESDLKDKRFPLDHFFHKLVMIRDNLRVLEQKVNSHGHLHDAEKVDLQRRITLAHVAVVRMGTGWLPSEPAEGPEATARALLGRLYAEAEWEAMALPPPDMIERFHGGRARFDHEESPVDEPIERFFHRLVVLRDRLMALEAQVEAHPHVAEQGDGMGGYIRRCYGTLTTFNVLLRDRADYFSSSR